MKKLFLYSLLAILILAIILSGCGGGTPTPTSYALRDTGPAGGLIFYDKGAYSDGWRYLEAAPVWTEWTNKQWSNSIESISAIETSIGSGKNNTALIVAAISGEVDRAAQICDALTYGGYSDWFLPSKDELNEIRTNLFLHNVGGFKGGSYEYYWSSSEFDFSMAWIHAFGNNEQIDYEKGVELTVRAIRSF